MTARDVSPTEFSVNCGYDRITLISGGNRSSAMIGMGDGRLRVIGRHGFDLRGPFVIYATAGMNRRLTQAPGRQIFAWLPAQSVPG
ncbi:hypothetical protein PE067_07925 [Paracoccus sp. DMF-8]|uniref:hypothetical protein n=1 Tax=Paracoccus sp. DMF-8 TaxID=3019445 RepID=UPI0023E8194E|nr:hypothetical protein [Paracoccus sp. DMF-8]MDF3606056.1 hypothetical protein [Paracoccus sp. DMF-8]